MADSENMQQFKDELKLHLTVLMQNRHSSATGEWFGPDPEPNPADPKCSCQGCFARFYDANGDLKGK